MFRASTAHHQELRCMYVANGKSKMVVNEPGCNVTVPFHPSSLTINLEVPFATYIHLTS
jgi:hypothetical protein